MSSGITPAHLVVTIIVVVAVIALIGYLIARIKGSRRND